MTQTTGPSLFETLSLYQIQLLEGSSLVASEYVSSQLFFTYVFLIINNFVEETN